MSSSTILETESPQVPHYYSGYFPSQIQVERTAKRDGKNADPYMAFSLRRRVQKVSKRAALASRKIWDSNDASIDAAQSAVDKWEHSYRGIRSFLIHSSKQCLSLYNATKVASEKIEHSLLVPIRDMVLLPAFSGIEQTVDSTVVFFHSDEAANAVETTLQLVKRTPFIGETILAPTLITSTSLMKSAWNVAKYPIPSRENVRYSVDTALTFTKWAISSGSQEIYFYAKLVDATLTRVWFNTQWRILGIGPYSTLSNENKADVINHLCERYLSLDNHISRYELAAHIKYQNMTLYHDLIETGLLHQRGGDITKDDVWLLSNPVYRMTEDRELLIPTSMVHGNSDRVQPLWFYLHHQNGKKPGRDTPWKFFNERERRLLELKYEKLCSESYDSEEKKDGNILTAPNVFDEGEYVSHERANWYDVRPDDILVDQKRHAVSFLSLPCSKNFSLVKPIHMRMYPTLWRFYGKGSDVRRAVWLMDTQRHGLQPYSDKSAAVLEDAFLFLKWKKHNEYSHTGGIDGVLLTVQVDAPDGEEQLVQFRSLTQVTAIQKSLGGGVSLFKRRVYRGASFDNDISVESPKERDYRTQNSEDLLAAPHTLHSIENSNSSHLETADHLILVIHGIGEMLRTTDLFGLSLLPSTSSIVECCTSLRKNHAEVITAHNSSTLATSTLLGRTEYLPIEWHEPFTLNSRRKATSSTAKNNQKDGSYATLQHISLTTIPHLRNFANDTLLDILYFMSPDHHDIIINIVCHELNTVVEKYRSLTGFNGTISLLSHSLGSVISWDILSNHISTSKCEGRQRSLGLSLSSTNSVTQECKPSLLKSYPIIRFDVSHSFMIGSPVGVFLMLRGQSSDPFCIDSLPGCKRVYNIFHPYDPVAYRIEPLIESKNARVDPKIITHWKGGFRVQYQTKMLWKRIIDETRKTQKTVVDAVERSIEGVGLLDATVHDLMEENEDDSSINSEDSNYQVVTGNLCKGRRVDYMLQEKEIENANEYLSALAAHSSYWNEKDLSLFIARQIFRTEHTKS